jgi:hypothetical protein
MNSCPFCNKEGIINTFWKWTKFYYGTIPLSAYIPVRVCLECFERWTDSEADDILEGVIQKHFAHSSSR